MSSIEKKLHSNEQIPVEKLKLKSVFFLFYYLSTFKSVHYFSKSWSWFLMSHLYNLVNCDPCLWIHVTHGGQNTLQITTDRRGLEHKKFMYIKIHTTKIHVSRYILQKNHVYQDTYYKNSCLSRYILQKFMFIKIHTTKIHVYQDIYPVLLIFFSLLKIKVTIKSKLKTY